MTAITRFEFNGQPFRAVGQAEEIWFIASDALAALDLNRSSVALLDEDEKGVHTMDTLGGGQQVTIISEAGLYSLILRSRKTEAKSFKRWITHEVLPAIRKTGSYGGGLELDLRNDEHIALILGAGQAALARAVLAEAKVAELAPKAEVADRLLNADGDLSVADTAKALTRAGVKVGEGRLFAALKERNWIYRGADGRWRVYQSAIESGHMSVLPQSHYHPKTGVLVLDPPQPRVTPKGLQKLLADHGAVVIEPVFVGASA